MASRSKRPPTRATIAPGGEAPAKAPGRSLTRVGLDASLQERRGPPTPRLSRYRSAHGVHLCPPGRRAGRVGTVPWPPRTVCRACDHRGRLGTARRPSPSKRPVPQCAITQPNRLVIDSEPVSLKYLDRAPRGRVPPPSLRTPRQVAGSEAIPRAGLSARVRLPLRGADGTTASSPRAARPRP